MAPVLKSTGPTRVLRFSVISPCARVKAGRCGISQYAPSDAPTDKASPPPRPLKAITFTVARSRRCSSGVTSSR